MINNIISRRERFIITSIEIIDDLGIQGLSTREIARRQGVSEATLFRHFKNKNGLLIAILDYFSKFDSDIFNSTKLKPLNSKEAIIYYINSYIEYYENYPAITSIMQTLEPLRYEPELRGRVEDIFNNRISYIKQLIDAAKESRAIPYYIDSENLSIMISGFCKEICLKWRFEDGGFALKERVLSTLEGVLRSFEKSMKD